MATMMENYLHLSRLFFVFKTIGDIFFKTFNFTSIIRRFVFEEHQDMASEDTNNAVQSVAAEAESVLYLHPTLLSSHKDLFKEFHDFTLGSLSIDDEWDDDDDRKSVGDTFKELRMPIFDRLSSCSRRRRNL